MKEYEIWLGYYHLGQGDHGSSVPEMVDKIIAINFKTACFKYELASHIDRINRGELSNNLNSQDYEWFWNPTTNINSWTGKYFESYSDALKSFEK